MNRSFLYSLSMGCLSMAIAALVGTGAFILLVWAREGGQEPGYWIHASPLEEVWPLAHLYLLLALAAFISWKYLKWLLPGPLPGGLVSGTLVGLISLSRFLPGRELSIIEQLRLHPTESAIYLATVILAGTSACVAWSLLSRYRQESGREARIPRVEG